MKNKYLDISLKDLRKILGKSNSKIISEPVNNNIIMVDENTYYDKISWEYIIKARGNHKKNLLTFLEYKSLYTQDDFKKIKKHKINELPDIHHISFNSFWNFQIKDFKRRKHKNTNKNNTLKYIDNELDLEKIKTTFNLSEDLLIYFRKNNKELDLFQWLGNIPKNSKIVFHINLVLKFLDTIINNVSYEPLDINSVINLKSNNGTILYKNEQEQWLSDSILYIGSFNNPEEINDIYDKSILCRGSFLNALFMLECQGVGRGEVLLTYLLRGSTFPGGGEPYDLVINKNLTYEIKEYSNIDESGFYINSIRLGTGGKLSRFKFWKNLEHSIIIAKKTMAELGSDFLEKHISEDFLKVWTYFISDDPYLENNKAVSSAASAGEINDERLTIIKLWFYLANEYISLSNISDDKFNLGCLYKGNGDYKYVSIDEEVDVSTNNIRINHDYKDKLLYINLNSLKYVRDPLSLDSDMNNVAKEYFDHNKEIDYFLVFRPKEINIVKGEDFNFARITQSSVKIIESKYNKNDRDIFKAAYIKSLNSNIDFLSQFKNELLTKG